MIVISFFMPIILCFTVLASVSFGVLAAYLAVLSIFFVFSRTAPRETPITSPRLVLVPTQNHAGGD